MQHKQKPHLSSSQLDMYSRCGEAYRRRYIEGEIIPPGIALIVGGAMHKGAETNFRQKIESYRDLPISEIVDAAAAEFDTRVSVGGCAFTDEEVSVGTHNVLGAAKDQAVALAQAHATQQAPDYQPVSVEHTTRIVLPGADYDLLAVTDLRDDEGRVTDLKTAAKKKPQSEADTSQQLTIYAAAYQVDTGQPPTEVRLDVLTKTKAVARQVLASHRDENDFRVLAARMNTTITAIQAGVFLPAPVGSWVCSAKWCGYYSTCPFVNSERRAAAEGAE